MTDDAPPLVPQRPSTFSWGAMIISVLIMGAWISTLVAQQFFNAKPLNADDAASLRNLAFLVGGYWIGSSAGSWKKDNRVPSELIPQPAAVVPVADVRPLT